MNKSNGYKSLILIALLFTITIVNSSGQCYFMQADKFENIWVVNQSEVICFSNQSTRIGTYSNILLGTPSYIDALDPFKVIVFYPSSQTMVVLNNAVAEISEPIRLREKGVNEASLVCRSSKGGFWLLDRERWQVIYFDSGFNPTGEKMVVDNTFSGSTPTLMREYKGILYIAFKGNGVCRFDLFGARLGDIPIRIDSYFTIIDNELVFQTGGKVFQYNLDSFQIKTFDPAVLCVPIKVQGKLLYFDGSRIAVYKI